jgi:hypothetical protein
MQESLLKEFIRAPNFLSGIYRTRQLASLMAWLRNTVLPMSEDVSQIAVWSAALMMLFGLTLAIAGFLLA